MKKFKEVQFPKTRIATLDVLEVGKKKHHIAALLELDVTDARKKLKTYRQTSEKKISFTAWLIKTISQTIEEYQSAHAYLKNKKTMIIFEDIDVSITVEREYDGKPVPLPYVIRKTNQKDAAEITREIFDAKNQQITGKDIVLGRQKGKLSENFYYYLPGFLRRFIWQHFLVKPKIAKKLMGSVILISIGMMGQVKGWFVLTSIHPIAFGIGSILKKPWVVNNQIEIREILHMTVLIDHDVMDGAPMARFITKFSKNVECGLGLDVHITDN